MTHRPVPEPLQVALGAGIGALARLAFTALTNSGMWPLLTINAIGAYLMGRLRPGPFLGTGVLGGFTSFSTFIALTSHANTPQLGAAYAVLTVTAATVAWLAGDYVRRAGATEAKNAEGSR